MAYFATWQQRFVSALAVMCLVFATPRLSAENWTRFRGGNGAGQGTATVPLQWSEDDIRWRREVPGVGHGSPVIWNSHLFVTSANPTSAERYLTAFDAHTGEQLWQNSFPSSTHRLHLHNTYASSTPAVDAEHVYLIWATPDDFTVIAFSHLGDEVWRRDFPSGFQGEHGHGSSPIVANGLVYVVNHHEGENFVVALESGTGDIRWMEPQPPTDGMAAYGTPCLAETPSGRSLLVTTSTGNGMLALDALTGDVVWQLPNLFVKRCCSSPIWAGGMVIGTSGTGGGAEHLVAVRAGDSQADTQEIYRIPRAIAYVPTPVVKDQLLFLWHDGGTVSCHDLTTGRQHWRRRVGGNFLASPILVGDRLYGVSTEGEVIVLSAGRDFAELARTSLGETTHATPAVAHDRLYFRTASSVICVGQ